MGEYERSAKIADVIKKREGEKKREAEAAKAKQELEDAAAKKAAEIRTAEKAREAEREMKRQQRVKAVESRQPEHAKIDGTKTSTHGVTTAEEHEKKNTIACAVKPRNNATTIKKQIPSKAGAVALS